VNKNEWMSIYGVSVWWNGAAYEAQCYSQRKRISVIGESEDLVLHELAYKMPVKTWEDAK
jgi:hypothetical protein